MRRFETREVEVLVCDFCDEERDHLFRCIGCGKEMCDPSKKGHAAYFIKISNKTPIPEGRTDSTVRDNSGHLCFECTNTFGDIDETLGDVLERLYWGKYRRRKS